LGNRTTAQERVSYHVAESYATRQQPVQYGSLLLQETDSFGSAYRALPPAEQMVLLAWFKTDAQRQLAESEQGFAYVRLGRRSGGGGLHVHPHFARVRNILLRTGDAAVARGLLCLREPGFHVFTRKQLRAELNQHAKGAGVAAWQAGAGADDDEYIYALFKTRRDPGYDSLGWDGNKILDQIENFEADARNKPVTNVGRASAYPRIIPLLDLLRTRAAS
jgi:hypothetical protein